MRVRISPSPNPLPRDLGGALAVPGSKSHTQRAMLLAAFLPGERKIAGALRAVDTEVLGTALERLGAKLRWTEKSLFVRGREGFAPDADLDLGENATALRALLAIVPLLGGRLHVRGSRGLAARPLDPSFALLAQGGVTPSAPTLPCSIDARNAKWPARLELDASLTTQVATGALLGVALRCYWGSDAIVVAIRAASAPEYLDVTLATLADAGFEVTETTQGTLREVSVALGSKSTLRGFRIPPDASSLCFPRALAAMHGLAAPAWLQRDRGDPHPDHRIVEDLVQLLRAPVGGRLVVTGMAARPDAVPAFCVVAATRAAETEIRGLAALRHKESDRIRALVRALSALGVRVREEPDGLVVKGPLPLAAARGPLRVPVPADHRIVMALALLGTLVGGGLELEHADAVRKSWPGYWEWLGTLAQVEPIDS